MIISDLAVRKRTSVVVLAFVIAISGIVAYYSLPREAAPDITIPYVFVLTNYPGVAPEDIEGLADSMYKMIYDVNSRRKFGKEGRKWAKNYNWNLVSKQQEDFYYECINRR